MVPASVQRLQFIPSERTVVVLSGKRQSDPLQVSGRSDLGTLAPGELAESRPPLATGLGELRAQ
jgi:hypothetical protein